MTPREVVIYTLMHARDSWKATKQEIADEFDKAIAMLEGKDRADDASPTPQEPERSTLFVGDPPEEPEQ